MKTTNSNISPPAASQPSNTERKAFEASFPNLDHSMKLDAWGRLIYEHSHVEAMFEGFCAGLSARAAIAVQSPAASQPSADVHLETYDAGLLNDYGGGKIEWWQDYIRAELARAHEFYQSQCEFAPAAVQGEK